MRPRLSEEQVTKLLAEFEYALRNAMLEKGTAIFMSSHEISGVVREEVMELESAVHGNDLCDMKTELLDIAVAAIWGVGSINSEKMDWPQHPILALKDPTETPPVD